MAIDTTKSWQEFTADGETAFFTFNFNYIPDRPTDIIVGIRTDENTYQVLESSNYQITPNTSTNGGQVRLIKRVMVGNNETIQDNIPAAGTVVRIARKSLDTSNATWRVGLEMSELIKLFDRLFRLTQENKGRFANTIRTFATQHGVRLYELLSAHNNTLLYWDNETKTLTPTEFPKSEIVRCVGGLFFRIQKNTATDTDCLQWSRDTKEWVSIGVSDIQYQITELKTYLQHQINQIRDRNTFIWEQAVAQSTWTVYHGLNRRPSVTVVDSAKNIVDCAVTYIDDDTVELHFSAPFKGTVYLN